MYVPMYIYLYIYFCVVLIFNCINMFTIKTSKQKQTKMLRTKPLMNLVTTLGNINTDDMESHAHGLEDLIVSNLI